MLSYQNFTILKLRCRSQPPTPHRTHTGNATFDGRIPNCRWSHKRSSQHICCRRQSSLSESSSISLFHGAFSLTGDGYVGRVEAPAGEESAVPVQKAPAVDLTAAIATITSAKKAYSESKLPPTPPSSFKRWRPERAPDAPHDPHAYFPMLLVK